MPHITWSIATTIKIAFASVLLAGSAITFTPAVASAAGSPNQPATTTTKGVLDGVAATSAKNAWAVGYTKSFKTLILHWNGTSWKQVTSRLPATNLGLSGVAATSATNAWAVGQTATGGKTLIVHWNGKAWSQQASPTPGGSGFLSAVAATSATSAWAVGGDATGTVLILHWNGKAWKDVPDADSFDLNSVTAASARSAWTVGELSC